MEDSAIIALPAALAEVWRGCGRKAESQRKGRQLFVRWEVLGGQIFGPKWTDAHRNDRRRPCDPDDLLAGALSRGSGLL